MPSPSVAAAHAWPGRDGGEAIDATEASRLAHAVQVLGDPARIRILSIIASHAPRPSSVTELVDQLDLSQSTVSHHLRTLVDAGFLDREQSGTWGLYRARPGALRDLAARIDAGDDA